VIEPEQRIDRVELAGETQLHVRLPCAEMGDERGERAGEMLDAERIGVAGRLERRAFMGAVAGTRGDGAAADMGRQLGQDLGQVRIDAGDRLGL
jgi:hypothetical protein